ncbi:GIY-YIG nuclease family protein [Gilliamella apicola]|uniref:Bacteriophage T5 Orf172 DNA-binding domain-containing protein n=1 Tax=Gilliamella apicola TaxID=1196095 RepID=A0A242NEZ4_9GAMM|nr:GIY-YIG nuclease family protein [Gilliamella apicola]OTP81171.1 hypothetical protein B5S40_12875 [Gilliamella apicola]OTP84550.1 hypothetical protein B5S44_09860 [Gilliamella apicola]OTP98359.1 hypothetical protein B6D08_11500 [Gilliamella apicola]OTQ08370.1 hypothetical protein B6C91_12615 [Gilliamella apicola]OTQ13331.1 hypothetical protein B6D11_10305 [Gilliamella apicola]
MNDLNIDAVEIENMTLPSSFKSQGFVYVLENELMPGIYKIGMTTKDVQGRCDEISNATGVPLPFKVVSYYHSDDPFGDEKLVHEWLSEYRINPNREFFKCSLSEIEQALDETCLFKATESLDAIADNFDIICLSSNVLDIDKLFEDKDIRVLGHKGDLLKLALSIGLDQLMNNGFFAKSHSMIIDEDGSIKLIKSLSIKAYEDYHKTKKPKLETNKVDC